MAKILFVVHRYVPFEGGSEYYVRDMAEEMLARGHSVTVLAHEHQGDQNGVTVTNDYQILIAQSWNLILVHGGDVISQNIVHANAKLINTKSPVAYMLIKPSESDICMDGLEYHRFVTYSANIDIAFLKKHGKLDKARRIRHGIVPGRTIATKIEDYGGPWTYEPMTTEVTTLPPGLGKDLPYLETYVSAGGFWAHKAMVPLATAFEQRAPKGMELHLYGYGPGIYLEDTEKVKWIKGASKETVMDAIANANGYIMNSYEEGFGLVLLEAMMNKTPWLARAGSGAADQLSEYGVLYTDEEGLMDALLFFKGDFGDMTKAYDYVMSNHTITQTCNDIEDILHEL